MTDAADMSPLDLRTLPVGTVMVIHAQPDDVIIAKIVGEEVEDEQYADRRVELLRLRAPISFSSRIVIMYATGGHVNGHVRVGGFVFLMELGSSRPAGSFFVTQAYIQVLRTTQAAV